MPENGLLEAKIEEVQEEMKRNGLWLKNTPAWVMNYGERSVTTSEDFSEWLQFIYLPNRKLKATGKIEDDEKNYIALQAMRFFGNDIKKGKLLQLLIELDSLL